jgi:hypothetical protein
MDCLDINFSHNPDTPHAWIVVIDDWKVTDSFTTAGASHG